MYLVNKKIKTGNYKLFLEGIPSIRRFQLFVGACGLWAIANM